MKTTWLKAIACFLMLATRFGTAPQAMAEVPGTVQAHHDAQVPTFSGDIAAIVYRQCVQCHRPDGGAPFSLLTFDEVKRRARMMLEVTESGFMPPWKVDKSDLEFVNERHLPASDKALLAAWVAAGAPIGDASAVPPAPTFPSDWQHGKPDLVLEMEEEMPIPASGTDIYRAFVVHIPDLPQGKYLKGLEYKPRAITTAHHTLFSLDSTGAARQQSEAQPRPGFSGGGAGGGAMGRIAGWAVGGVPAMYPEGASLEIPPGSDLVLSSHFHPTGKPEVERSQVALYLTDEQPTRFMSALDVPFMFGALKNIRIPAGDPNYLVKETYTLPVDANLAYISPHAHYLAKTMQMTATLPDGKTMTLISIRDWDFAWQEQYELAKEVALPKGTRLDMEFVYDNSANNPRNPTNPPKEVLWGLQSTDEMACMTLGLIAATKEIRSEMRHDYVAWVKKDVETADPRIAMASFSAMNKDRFDLNGDGQVTWKETFAMGRQIYKRFSSARATSGGRPGAGDEMAEVRAQILPTVLKRVLRLVFLPWFLPRLAAFAAVVVALVYLLRTWRATRRKRRALDAVEA